MDADSTVSAQAGIGRVVKRSPNLFRRASAGTVLAVLASATLAPAVVAVAGGGAVAAALAAIAGSVGSPQVTALVQRCAQRIRGTAEQELPSAAEAALTADLTATFEHDGDATLRLQADLVRLIDRIGGFETALANTAGDLRERLDQVFQELSDAGGRILDRIDDLGAAQYETAERIESLRAEQQAGFGRLLQAGAGASLAVPGEPELLFAEAVPEPPRRDRWEPGLEITVERSRYLLYDLLVDERRTPDGSALLRRGVAMRRNSTGGRADRFVWLRQVHGPRGGPSADAARVALRREHDLLDTLGNQSGFPRPDQIASSGGTLSSALIWPSLGREAGPCETLGALAADDGEPLTDWAAVGLYRGLAGLCKTLAVLHRHGASHRDLTLDGILMPGTESLALRDLGHAGREPRPGETSSVYTAPEQRRRAPVSPGPATDVYQVAAVAYHLIVGHPPPRAPVPPPHTPRSAPLEALHTTLAAALANDPAARPRLPALADAFRSAADSLK